MWYTITKSKGIINIKFKIVVTSEEVRNGMRVRDTLSLLSVYFFPSISTHCTVIFLKLHMFFK